MVEIKHKFSCKTVNETVLYDFLNSGHNVEEAFLETAKKIFQSIQDGRWVLRLVAIAQREHIDTITI